MLNTLGVRVLGKLEECILQDDYYNKVCELLIKEVKDVDNWIDLRYNDEIRHVQSGW